MIIELLCTFSGIIAGIAIVASLVQQKGSRAQFQAGGAEVPSIDPDKMQGIASQLQAISVKVAANVSEHSEKVGKFSGQLSPEDADSILATINDIIAANEEMQGQLASAQDRIDQQTQMIEQASHQARTDALTGLSNRRALDEFLSNSIESAQPDDCVALLLMDIDHFKNFNDSFGHTTGDAVLSSFARAISNQCDADCYPARFGGEEFAVIVSGKDQEAIVRKAADIRYFVSEQVISYEELQLKITASGGMCFLDEGDDLSTAYERADQGLYKSKEAGRNRGYWHNGEEWAPFPGPVQEGDEAKAEAAQDEPEAENDKKPSFEAAGPGDSVAAIMSEFTGGGAPDPEAALEDPIEEEGNFELLDLKTFMERVGEKVENVRRGELAASGIMIEAVGLKDADPAEAGTSWEHTIALIQVNLRGIDVICQFRPFALCVFFPGCAEEVAIERAAIIQASLPKAKGEWPEIVRPERFAISLAQIDAEEEPNEFLDRLEMSLDEAMTSKDNEIAVHDGEGCKFKTV
ncbi:MAG: hypothetical protein Aurels2KO_19290 [Aureliella sp.]